MLNLAVVLMLWFLIALAVGTALGCFFKTTDDHAPKPPTMEK